VKTTVEIPSRLLRRAKSKAAQQGIPLQKFVSEAIEDRLKRSSLIEEGKPWIKHLGKLRRFRKETKRINKAIEEVFEKIDPEGCL
jgi:hypothetical protein